MQEVKPIEINLTEHIESGKFRSKLKAALGKIEKGRSDAVKKAGRDLKFKRSAIDYLKDIGKYNIDGIVELMPDIIAKKSKLPASVRMFINELTYNPIVETISEHMQREQLKSEKPTLVES